MKKRIKAFIGILFAVSFSMALILGGRALLVDDTTSYSRIMMHEMYHPEENIDVLFIGASHSYYSLNPEILDEHFGAYTFVAGSANQYMDGSYALLKEAGEKNDIKKVYLELYYDVADSGDYKKRTDLTSTYIITDYMRPSFRKTGYILSSGDKETWMNAFFPVRRSAENLFEKDYVRTLWQKKHTDAYRNHKWVKGEEDAEYYVNRGYVESIYRMPAVGFDIKAYDEIDLKNRISKDSDWRRYIGKISDYCEKNNIMLTFYIAPQMEGTLVGKGNYQEYHDLIAEIAAEEEVEFVDFNLVKQEYFDTKDPSLCKDWDHLNKWGAEEFSHLFGRVFAEELDKEEVFHASFDEKLKSEGLPVYGVAYENTDTGRNIRIISAEDDLEFAVYINSEEKEPSLIRDYSADKEFTVGLDEKSDITICYRGIHNPEKAGKVRVTE